MTFKLFLHGLTCELEIEFFSALPPAARLRRRLRGPPAAVSADI
jgi:hypothetical protein